MIKLLIGGSPCTFWSIAQKNGRETEAEGMGWELFKNYLIAKEKFKPDFFLYENNKSAAQAIKDQISHELGVDLMHINSALVSAQNRQRFYAFNWTVDQPEDRGLILRDVLETNDTYDGTIGIGYRGRMEDGRWVKRYESREDDKANALTTAQTDSMVAEQIKVLSDREMDYMVRQTRDGRNHFDYGYIHDASRDKSQCITANMHKGVPYNVLCEPVDGPVRIGTLPRSDGAVIDHQQSRIYSIDGKATNLNANGGGQGAKTGLYAIPVEGEERPVYEVKDGLITIKERQYPIKLKDGYYVIRKLTPVECERLQTLPDNYTAAVSNTQRYKGLGNGWTAEVIIHILNGALANVPRDEEIVVLSMYDGIGTGRYCLDKMGFTNVKYFAYEIDKYAKEIALSNYPDIIHCGDAFDLRNPDWTIGY